MGISLTHTTAHFAPHTVPIQLSALCKHLNWASFKLSLPSKFHVPQSGLETGSRKHRDVGFSVPQSNLGNEFWTQHDHRLLFISGLAIFPSASVGFEKANLSPKIPNKQKPNTLTFLFPDKTALALKYHHIMFLPKKSEWLV